MLYAAILCLIFAALGGIMLLLSYHFKGEAPLALALGHGTFAVSGLSLFVIAFVTLTGSQIEASPGLSAAALTVLIETALAGLFIFSRRWFGSPPKLALIFLHASLALTAITFISLVTFL